MTDLPRCPKSDLPRLLCDHCDGFTMTAAERSYLARVQPAGKVNHSTPVKPNLAEFPQANLDPYIAALKNAAQEAADRHSVDVASLTDYSGGGWTTPQPVKAIDSNNPCTVPGCTRAAGDNHTCPHCLDSLEVALGDAPALLEDLLVMAVRQHRFRAPNISRTPAHGTRWDATLTPGETRHLIDEGFNRTPYSAQAGNAQRKLNAALVGAARSIPSYPAEAVDEGAAASRWLLRNWQAVVNSSAIATIVHTITDAHRQAMQTIDRPADADYIGRCPNPACDASMYADTDQAEHRCTTCGETVNVADRQDAIRDKLADSRLTLKQIAALSGPALGIRVTLAQLKNWANRDAKLTHTATDQEGTRLYRVGDVLEKISELP